MNKTLRILLMGIGVTALVCGQATPAQTSPRRTTVSTGSVRGTVKDDTGGVIPGAVVTLATQSGTVQTVHSGSDGNYTFRGVAPGTYTVSATYAGLQQQGIIAVTVAAGQAASGNIVMTVQTQRQEVTVTDTSTNTVSTEPSNNATALVLKQEDLDALPDDPDDLQADLEALAGPSAGPGGNQIYIDGFTGGRLPPKESIREIRINSNPFSAEFDKLGYGRIQIFTKPGSDKFHGQGYYNISDSVWNARNPFVFPAPPFRTQLFGGNVSGPLGKHASFFIDVERRDIDDNGVITATVPNSTFTGTATNQGYYPTPQRRTTVSPRVDYQLGANNTLSFRYVWLENDHNVTGIGTYFLPNETIGGLLFPSNGYSSSTHEQSAQIVETAVLSAKTVNETHFQFDRENTGETSQSTAPELAVQSSFVSGGSGYSSTQYPRSYLLENNYELQNYTSVTWGPHVTKFGIRIRATMLDNSSPGGFNGEFQFNGGAFPVIGADGLPIAGTSAEISSIQQYLTTVRLLNAGYSSQMVTDVFGYGPSKYTVTAGNPYIGLSQIDFGPFIQDDWRVKPNFTLSLGLRWEAQTNIPDKNDWAPRVGFAWAPGQGKRGGRAKTVIRGGWGFFYDRFAINNVLTAYQENGLNQIAYTENKPDVYNTAFTTTPSISGLQNAIVSNGQIYEIDSHLQAPRLMETAVGVEQQILAHTTLSVNYVNSRGTHEFRTVDINAPYPVPGCLPPGTSAAVISTTSTCVSPSVRPFPNEGDIYDFQSDGIFKQTQVMVNVNSQVGRWLTLFTRYSFSNAHSDTDGVGSFASDPYDFAADWGRSSLDIQHSFFLGGSLMAKWGLRFSPFIIAHTGVPFNFTTGNDLFLQGARGLVARPALVSSAGPGVIDTPYGYLYPYPTVPEPGTLGDLIERNAGTGPGYIGINLRVSKTWGFGTTKFSGPSGGAHAGGGGGHHGGGFGGFGMGGPHGFGESSEHRYNLTVSVNARNMLNHTNLNTPIGTLTSPMFLQSNGITGGFSAENTSSENRRLDLQLRFTF